MVRIERDGSLTQVFATTKRGKTILLTWRKETPKGPVFGHSAPLAFFEKRDGTIKSSPYLLGLTDRKRRRFVATPGELLAAFEAAHIIPTPAVVSLDAQKRRQPLRVRIAGIMTGQRRDARQQTIR